MQFRNASRAATDGHDWAVVLSGGHGRRMRHLTITPDGTVVPKQYCGLGNGPSFLHLALQRAAVVAPPDRILVTVTREHRRWWKPLGEFIPARNILVEPVQRGTGIGILRALIEIVRRDARAVVTILPADHFFVSEAVIATGLTDAVRLARRFPRDVLLLGFEPDVADPDLGYIVPGPASADEPRHVSRFVEKPDAGAAASLIHEGALVNSFITVASAAALMRLFERRHPRVVRRLRQLAASLPRAIPKRHPVLASFRALPSVDFSQHVLGAAAARLRVVRVPACGWSDLGTPARLERVLRRHGKLIARTPEAPPARRGRVNLCEHAAALTAEHQAA